MSSFYIESDDIAGFSSHFLYQDEEVIKYAIAAKHPERYKISEIKDSRFHPPSLFTSHGCMAYSIKAYGASSTRSFFLDRVVKPLAVYVSLPIAHAQDLVTDICLGALQTSYFIISSVRRVQIKVLNGILFQDNPIDYRPYETAAWRTAQYGFFSLGLIIADLLAFPILGWGESLYMSGFVYNMDTKDVEGIVDQSKFQWLQKKFSHLTFEKEKFLPVLFKKQHKLNAENTYLPVGVFCLYSESETEIIVSKKNI